jgi:bifunctional ADP-heptose synthase (sugar kinase/adenylyltransferase)
MTLKPNKQEAINAVGCEYDPRNRSREDFCRIAETLSHMANGPVFLTLGKDGILVHAKKQAWHCPAAPTHPPLDPVGAGDTCIAAIALSLAVGAKVWEAGVIANLAAAVTVEKLNQTGTASPEEILSRYELVVKSDNY